MSSLSNESWFRKVVLHHKMFHSNWFSVPTPSPVTDQPDPCESRFIIISIVILYLIVPARSGGTITEQILVFIIIRRRFFIYLDCCLFFTSSSWLIESAVWIEIWSLSYRLVLRPPTRGRSIHAPSRPVSFVCMLLWVTRLASQ